MKIKKTFQGSLPENKILNSNSTSQTDTYSCDYINSLDVNLIQGEIENGVVLWENPNPTEEFAAQTITLTENNCDYYDIYYRIIKSNQCLKVERVKVGMPSEIALPSIQGFLGYPTERGIRDVTNSSITFNDATINGNVASNPNNYLVPVKIIGYKDTMPAVVVKEKTEEIYSTEETVIGKWIDGKPLYRKTIDCGNLPNNTEISIQHNCENADFCNMYGIIKGIGQHWPLNMFQTSNVANGVQIAIAAGTINIKTTTDKRNFKAYITLEYTKTTD